MARGSWGAIIFVDGVGVKTGVGGVIACTGETL